MSHPILERHLKDRSLKPVYLFYGEEEFLMQRAWRRLQTWLEEQAGEAPLFILQEAGETKLEEFLSQARVPPLWGSGQLLILRHLESYPDIDLQGIVTYREHPCRRSWIILTAPSLKRKDVEKHRIWRLLSRDEAAIGFMRLKEEELCQWLAREARKGGKNLPLPAAQRLVEVVGDNLAELTQELEKLTLFAGPESTLTPNLVSRLASHSRTYNIFALVDALGEANPQKRLTALDHLSDLGEPPVRILGMLARQLRLLIQIKEHPAGTPLEPLASKFSIPVGVLGRLSRQARAFSLDSLKTHLKVLHQADRQQKTSTSNPRLWLEWALLKMGPG